MFEKWILFVLPGTIFSWNQVLGDRMGQGCFLTTGYHGSVSFILINFNTPSIMINQDTESIIYITLSQINKYV